MSSCTWGGITKKEPAEAPLSTGTTAKPFFTLDLILWYDFKRDSSILDWNLSDFFSSSDSSFSVSFVIALSSFFLCFKCEFLSFLISLASPSFSFFSSIWAFNSLICFSAYSISSSWYSISLLRDSKALLFLTFFCWSLYFFIRTFDSSILLSFS